MKVLMTGATGLIGRSVGRRLVQAGHSVVALSRRPDQARSELPFPVEVFGWDGASLIPPSALEGVDAVLHLAGEPIADGRWTAERRERIRSSRVTGTARLVESLRASPSAARSLKVFVLGSAVGVYGAREGAIADEIATEDAPAGEDFLAQVCVDWESAGRALLDDSRFTGVRFAAVRTGIVLSREGGALAKLLPIFAKGFGGKVGSGQQWMSWIDINDIARMFVFALENPSVTGAVNGVAPVPARNEELSRALATAVGRGLFFPVPGLALRALYGEMASAILTGVRASAAKIEGLGFRFEHPKLAPALSALCAPEREGDKELLAEQWVPRPVSEVFAFFSDEKNLEKLTPEFLSFSVLGKSTPALERGTLIDYRLRLHGVPVAWQTEISEWEPGRKFVDEQLKGPYAKWHHTHEFEALGGGTLVRDRVRYRLPLGALGSLVAGWKVNSDVETIFAYRRKIISEIFG